MVANVVLHGKNVGLDLRFDQVHETNTFDAHRLTKGLSKLEHINTLNKALYEAHFSKGINLSDITKLVEIGQSLGIDTKLMNEILTSNQFETEVKRDIEEANRKNIHAVPYFLINGRTSIKGAQSLAFFVQTLSDNRAK
jgi:predicted DsbA family dithiol-disulfide isomerase